MLNKVELIGNVGKDPDIRRTQDGRPIANMRIATSEQWKDKSTGEKRERTEWHTVVVFSEGLAGVIEKHVAKGQQVYVCGKNVTRKWQDQSGQDRYSTEVHVTNGYDGHTVKMLGRKQDGGPRDAPPHDDYPEDAAQHHRPADSGRSMDDEIPF